MTLYSRKKRTGIMLCYPFEERRILNQMRSPLKWHWPVAVQPKLDGERCRAFYSALKESWELVSSTEEFLNFPVPHIVEALNHSKIPKTVELDGELYCHGWTFEEIHSVCSRRTTLHPEHKSISLHLFDIISGEPYSVRKQTLSWLSGMFLEGLVIVPTDLAYSVEGVFAYLKRQTDKGYEGVITRDLHAPYCRQRYTQIMKFKPKKEDTYEIVGVKEEKDKNGNPKDSLGAFICEKEGQRFSVGSGFTLHERMLYWKEFKKNPSFFRGLLLKIEYQNITSGKVPRFGVYKGILVKGGEDV